MSPAVVVLMLTLLLGIQPVSTDLYLPALPTLQHDLHAPLTAAQMTLSALILCFGVSQLVWGLLADRYGRRPVLQAAWRCTPSPACSARWPAASMRWWRGAPCRARPWRRP